MKLRPTWIAALLVGTLSVNARAAEPEANEPKPIPMSTVEIFRIAPGQHEAFLEMLAQIEAASAKAGMPPNQLFIHDSGAAWDFMLVKPNDYDPEKWQVTMKILHDEGFPRGPDYFFESRKMMAWHEDTTALGQTTATDYLATRKRE
jgi:hypothetical protein